MRVAVGLSGGADSVSLLRALAARSAELGLVVHAAHLHHGLRGAEADDDLVFCRNLTTKLGVHLHEACVDTAASAEPDPKSGKPRETIEEAARRLRYSWFRQLLSKEQLHVVATAHTLDDQAETVLAKFLRGAWTQGLAGISPVLHFPEGRILRPLLAVSRADIETYLSELGQVWREDTSNRHLTFTRNRIRHELLPLLEGWNPRLREHLVQMSDLAREEESWWQAELARLAPQMLLPGRSARGGGRSAGSGPAGGLGIEVTRLAALAPAMQRRLLRHAAEQFGIRLEFAATEALRSFALSGRAGQRLSFPEGLRAERTVRELRLSIGPSVADGAAAAGAIPEYTTEIPGKIVAPAFGLHLEIRVSGSADGNHEHRGSWTGSEATLRNWRPGDRVRLRHSSAPRKVKEVLERLRVTGTERALWPVLEVSGSIVWMRGADLEGAPGLVVRAGFDGELSNPSAERAHIKPR
jgi:tRNA(Ile)-lysidine synthase